MFFNDNFQYQHPNLYKHYKFHLMECKSYVVQIEPHTLSSRPFKFFFNSFIDFYSCEVFDNLLHASSCKMLTFCHVLHETKIQHKQTLECVQYRLEITGIPKFYFSSTAQCSSNIYHGAQLKVQKIPFGAFSTAIFLTKLNMKGN